MFNLGVEAHVAFVVVLRVTIFMKGKLLTIAILTTLTISTMAGHFGILLYHTKIELIDNSLVDGYFLTYADYPDPIKFKTEKEFKAFVVERTTYSSGVLTRLFQRAYKILDYQCIEEWLRGQVVLLKDENFALKEQDIKKIQLVSVTRVRGVEVNDLNDRLVKYLVNEPTDMAMIELDSKLTVIGDISLSYAIVSYNKSGNFVLAKIKDEIESKYFSESKNCDEMNVFQVWKPIYKKYKEELEKDNIFFIELRSY